MWSSTESVTRNNIFKRISLSVCSTSCIAFMRIEKEYAKCRSTQFTVLMIMAETFHTCWQTATGLYFSRKIQFFEIFKLNKKIVLIKWK
jgi:hypothetical protein